LVYSGQTVGWIKTPLGTEVGLGSSHTVLDGYPAHPLQRGTAPPIFGPCLLWPNNWLDQDATWCGGRPRPRRHYVTWGPIFHRRGTQPPFFGPCLLCPNGHPSQLLL